MRVDAEAPTIRLADYRPPAYLVDTRRARPSRSRPAATRVRARIAFRPNPARAGDAPLDLRLDGRSLEAGLGRDRRRAGAAERPRLDDEGLTVAAAHVPADGFVWEAETEIAPEANTALEGLYMSRGMYCTQCEAQGFRKITYWPDRPDVMATLPRAHRGRRAGAALERQPRRRRRRAGPSGRTRSRSPATCSRWSRATSSRVEDRFVTRSGRDVLLQIWVRAGDEDRCGYAMDALKRAMAWDEAAYGREYDLDRFMIVAVDDFNMGAMENKGLNIFNSQLRAGEPRDRDRRRLQVDRGDHRARVLPQLDRQPHHLPRLVPALPEGRADGLPRPAVLRRPAQRAAVKRIEDVIRLRGAAVPRGRRAAGAPGAAGGIRRDQQLLHRDRLREGRRGHRHAAPPGRPGDLRAARSTSTSSATTARPAPSRTGSRSSRTPRAATSRSSSAGTPRPARRGCGATEALGRRALRARRSPRRRRRRPASRRRRRW